MVLFPNCKINLGLRIVGKRADGFHNIDTVFYPLPLKDAIEVTAATRHTTEPFELSVSGLSLTGPIQDNLCYKAWDLLRADHPGMPAVRMHLVKGIPSGAGLGGGSSDAAHTLLLLNKKLALGLDQNALLRYALKLGSDCPFFIINQPAAATGRGEELRPISLCLDKYFFVLVDAGIHISTAWAFGKLPAASITHEESVANIVSRPVEEWKERLINEFERSVFEEYPSLADIREELYDAGALYASLTGTGSCVYGLFDQQQHADLRSLQERYTIYPLKHRK